MQLFENCSMFLLLPQYHFPMQQNVNPAFFRFEIPSLFEPILPHPRPRASGIPTSPGYFEAGFISNSRGKIVRFQKQTIRANTKMRIKKLVKLGRKSCETIENPLFRKEYSQPWSSSLCTSIHTINHHPIFLFDLQYLHFQIALKYNLNNICFHQTCLAASPKFHWPHLQLKSPKSGPSQINAFNLGLPTYPQF